MLRIYCDWNNAIDSERFDLGCHGSLEDIKRHAHNLKNGMRVVLYQTDELEMEGVIQFDEASERWIGIPDLRTIRFIGRSAADEKKA